MFISTFLYKSGKELIRQYRPTKHTWESWDLGCANSVVIGSHMVHISLWQCIKSTKNELGKKKIM